LASDGANISSDKVWDKRKLDEILKELADRSISKNWRDELKAVLNR